MADGLVTEHQAQIFKPHDGFEVQTEAGARPDGVEVVFEVDVIGYVVVVVVDQTQAGSYVDAGGQPAVEALGKTKREGEDEVAHMGLGAGVFRGLIDGAHGIAAKNPAFLEVAEVQLDVQHSHGDNAVLCDHILAFQDAEIQAQTTAGHAFRDVVHDVIGDTYAAGNIPGSVFKFIVIIGGLGQCRKAHDSHYSQSEQFFHHFWF